MVRYIFIFIFLLVAKIGGLEAASYLGQQLKKAQAGDYIVTNQFGSYSLLYVQALENNRLVLQEISVPESMVKSKIEWQDWVRLKAPGHTSWLVLEIDLQEGKLLESFDVDRKEWLYLQGEENLLVKLFNLPMSKVPDQERRRIGPPPSSGEEDHRAIWNPPQVFESSKEKSLTAAWASTWPADESPIAGCQLDLYYDLRNPDFPFPVSIDIQSPHYRAHIKVVRAGRKLDIPSQKVPRRPPQFLSHLNPGYTEYKIRLVCPGYYKQRQLYAVPVGSSDPAVLLPCTIARGVAPEEVVFIMNREQLNPILKKGCRYRLAFASPPYAEAYVETEATFVW